MINVETLFLRHSKIPMTVFLYRVGSPLFSYHIPKTNKPAGLKAPDHIQVRIRAGLAASRELFHPIVCGDSFQTLISLKTKGLLPLQKQH